MPRVLLRLTIVALLLETRAVGQGYRIDTIAGSDWVGDNDAATKGLLLQAEGIAADSGGNLYIADAGEHRVRKVTPSGLITTVVGTGIQGFSGDGGLAVNAQLNSPYGLVFDFNGNLYVADLGNRRVRRVALDGTITTAAGAGNEMVAPRNLALDGRGGIYISDFSGHRVYQLSSSGVLTVAAGTGTQGFSPDGTNALTAQLAYPTGLAVDRQGALYIADSQNHWIRKVMNGVISSFVRVVTPTSLTFDGLGSLYIADASAGQIIQIPAIGAPNVLNVQTRDLTVARDGYLYAVNGDVMFRVSFIGPRTVLAGGGSLAFGDNGPSTLSRLNHPSGVAADSLGNLYIADRDNHRIRRVSGGGTITTIAGMGVAGNGGDGGLATQAQLDSPSGVSVDSFGNLYIVDAGNQRVRMVTASGLILPVVATGVLSPSNAVADAASRVYITDGANGTLSQVSATGGVATLLGGLQSPGGIAVDPTGDIYFTEANGPHVRKLDPFGNLTSIQEGFWKEPRGVALSAAGDIFVSDTGRQQILRINSSSGSVSPIAGNGTAGFLGDGGAALSAELNDPWDITAGPGGTLYVADRNNNRIRILTPAPELDNAPVQATAVNAASLQVGPIAAGMLVLLRGTGLAAKDVISFNGTEAPILSVESNGLVVQAPAQIAGLVRLQITILAGGNMVGQIPVTVAATAPALFADASGQALANNEDGTVNSTAAPVSRGSMIVLYGTGEGTDGLPVSVSIGSNPALVTYAGPVAGYPGLLQINARVPSGYLSPGNLPVSFSVGQSTSQPGITIAVK